jgi:hypothetical protein
MKDKLNKSGIIYLNPDFRDKLPERSVMTKSAESGPDIYPPRKISQIRNVSEIKDGQHSFLFWLIVPLIVVWLSVGYFYGFVKENPSWTKTGYALNANKIVKPFIKEYPSVDKKSGHAFITIWLDDAWLSQYLTAYPILKQNGFPGTIAVPTEAVEKPGYVNWAQLRILQGSNWEITNHGNSHDCSMQNWDRTKIANDLNEATLLLWENQLTSDIFVTPCGVDSQTLREEAEKSFIGYRTVDPGFNSLNNIDSYRLKVKNIDTDVTVTEIKNWIDEAKVSKSWLILVFHKVGETSSAQEGEKYNISKGDFESIINYIKTQNIKVVVPSQMIKPISI